MATASARAIADGFRRVAAAPMLLCGVELLVLATALTAGVAVNRFAEPPLHDGGVTFNLGADAVSTWWEGLSPQLLAIADTVRPRLFGFGSVARTLRIPGDGFGLGGAVRWAAGTPLLLWIFLLGGVLTRLARQQRIGIVGFYSACGRHVFRLFRLGLVGMVVYWLVFDGLYRWVFGEPVGVATQSVLPVTGWDVFLRLVRDAIFFMVWLPASLVLDYASIRAVVEDRRSMIGAILAAARFIRRHLAAVVGLYLLNTLVLLIVLGGYAAVTTRLASSSSLMFGAGLAYVIASVAAALVFYASHVAYFQSRLAHATYVAAARPEWSEPPASPVGAYPPS